MTRPLRTVGTQTTSQADALSPQATVHLLHDFAALQALRPAWQQLEAAAPRLSLYDTHDHLCTVWQHLATPGDRLFVFTVRGAQDELVAAWPLVRRTTRRLGLPHHELRPLAIWEGERPRLLSRWDDAATEQHLWPLLWQALVAQRAQWHALVLPEVDAGSWPLRHPALPGPGFDSTVQGDTSAPWQAIRGDWAVHLARRPAAEVAALGAAWQALQRELPGLQVTVHDQPHTLPAAYERYLALDRLLQAHAGAHGDRIVTLSQRQASVAFYRDWLPRLAAQGAASIHLLGHGGRDVAGLIRLRCRGVGLERHACHDPRAAAHAPVTLLLADALQRSFAEGTLDECDAVNLPAPPGAGLQPFTWLDGRRATQRLRVVNLHGVQGLPARLRRRLRR